MGTSGSVEDTVSGSMTDTLASASPVADTCENETGKKEYCRLPPREYDKICNSREMEVLKKHIATPMKLREQDKNHEILLMRVSYNAWADAVALLLERNVDPNFPSRGNTAFIYACDSPHGDKDEVLKVVTLLCNAKADVNHKGVDSMTGLHRMLSSRKPHSNLIIGWVLNNTEFDINGKDDNDDKIIDIAEKNGMLECYEKISEHGVLWAMLCEKKEEEDKSNNGMNLLMSSPITEWDTGVHQLLKPRWSSEKSESDLIDIIEKGNQFIKSTGLIERKSGIKTCSEDFVGICRNRDDNRLLKYLSLEPDLDERNNNGDTLLLLAARHGWASGVDLLLERNADPNIVDRYTDNSFSAACGAQNDNPEEVLDVIKLLCMYRAEVNHQNAVGWTGLHACLRYKYAHSSTLIPWVLANTDFKADLVDVYGMAVLDWATKIEYNDGRDMWTVIARALDEHKAKYSSKEDDHEKMMSVADIFDLDEPTNVKPKALEKHIPWAEKKYVVKWRPNSKYNIESAEPPDKPDPDELVRICGKRSDQENLRETLFKLMTSTDADEISSLNDRLKKVSVPQEICDKLKFWKKRFCMAAVHEIVSDKKLMDGIRLEEREKFYGTPGRISPLKLSDWSDEFTRAVVYWKDHHCQPSAYQQVQEMQGADVLKRLNKIPSHQLNYVWSIRDTISFNYRYPNKPDKFKDLDKSKFNVVLFGKSGHGKSSLINAIGKHFNIHFHAPVGRFESTPRCHKYSLGEHMNVWDIPGYGLNGVEVGKDGERYLRDYNICHFDLILIVTASRETHAAVQLYKLLKPKGKQMYLIRTKVDIDVMNVHEKDLTLDRQESFEIAGRSIVKDVRTQYPGLIPERFALCSGEPPFYDVPRLCMELLKCQIHFYYPNFSSELLNKVVIFMKSKSLDDDFMAQVFNLSQMQINAVREYCKLKEDFDTVLGSNLYKNLMTRSDALLTCTCTWGSEVIFESFKKTVEDQHRDKQLLREDWMLTYARNELEKRFRSPYQPGALSNLEEFEKSFIKKLQFDRREADMRAILKAKKKDIKCFRKHKQPLTPKIRPDPESCTYDKNGNMIIWIADVRRILKDKMIKEVHAAEEKRLMCLEKEMDWILQADISTKRAYVWDLVYGSKTWMRDEVQSIDENLINDVIRSICQRDLLRKKHAEEDLLEKWKALPPPPLFNFNGQKNFKHIALVGPAGSGKSTLARTLISQLRPQGDIPVEIGVSGGTKEPKEYVLDRHVSLWDLPGACGWTAMEYAAKYHVVYFQLVIFVTSTRFYSGEIEIAKLCKKYGTKFLFVRTKFDDDLRQEIKRSYKNISFDRDMFFDNIRDKMTSELRGILGPDLYSPLYVINAKHHDQFNFPDLSNLIRSYIEQPEQLDSLHSHQDDIDWTSETYLHRVLYDMGSEYEEIADMLLWRGTDMYTFLALRPNDFLDLGKFEDLIDGIMDLAKKLHKCRPKIDQFFPDQGALNLIYNWTSEHVANEIRKFGEMFVAGADKFEEAISGAVLLCTPNEDLASLIEQRIIKMDSMTKLNFFRKLDRLRGRDRTREEIEQELIEPGESITRLRIFSSGDVAKVAVIIPVFQCQEYSEQISSEAWDLEKACLEAGFELLLFGSRTSIREKPVGAKLSDFANIMNHLHTNHINLDGAVVFFLSFGYTQLQGDNPGAKLVTEDGCIIDVQDCLKSFEDLSFSVILGIASGETVIRQEADELYTEFSIPHTYEIPENLTISWGTQLDSRSHTRFVDHWMKAFLNPSSTAKKQSNLNDDLPALIADVDDCATDSSDF